ncbi:MAG: M18 family aminopeptidase, partial [Clostridiales bacterium]|nr:M18 family aminopeptidase [Clostridiales bacterium]
IALFDNEEIGNRTKQGSASLSTLMLMEKLFDALGRSRIEMYDVFHRSIILSMDVAQAYHPNYTGKFDPTNIAELNKGVVFKIDTLQRYAFDTGAVGMIQQLCEENNIPYQKYTNRSDATAGSTMGPVISTQLPTRTVDMGVAILAMHSAVETMGTKDQESLNKLMRTFFSVSR